MYVVLEVDELTPGCLFVPQKTLLVLAHQLLLLLPQLPPHFFFSEILNIGGDHPRGSLLSRSSVAVVVAVVAVVVIVDVVVIGYPFPSESRESHV